MTARRKPTVDAGPLDAVFREKRTHGCHVCGETTVASVSVGVRELGAAKERRITVRTRNFCESHAAARFHALVETLVGEP